MGRELEGLELVPFGWADIFLFSETPNTTSPLMNTVKVSVENAGKATETIAEISEGALKTNEHHAIPKALKNNDVVKAAREEGFKFEGKENKISVPKFSRATGRGQHANHPNYNSAIQKKIDAGVPENMTPAEFIRSIAKDAIETIKANPETKINDLLKSPVESTGTIKVALPKAPPTKKQTTKSSYPYPDLLKA